MAKTDIGVKAADREFLLLEKRLQKVYAEAGADIQAKMDAFYEKHRKKNERMLKQLEREEITQEDYQKWLKGQVFQGEQWKARKESIANTLLRSNEAAVSLLNEAMPTVFQVNGNYAAYQLEHNAGVDFSFNLYNDNVIQELLAKKSDILPYKKLKKGVDLKWNFRSIKNEVAKGIIEGESIDKIAKRLTTVIPDRNKALMRTHARTMCTSAQNKGRLARFEEAQAKGLVMEKEWFCTLDGRTRDTHRLLDRQRRPLDVPFKVEGFEIMYPADPHADPSQSYNCRCTMNSYLKKYPPQYKTRSAKMIGEDGKEHSVLIDDMSYEEWLQWKEGQ